MIKFGLRKIFLSYSRISLADICSKLHMDSVAETEYIVAKAIRDGVIDATINHEEQYLQTKVADAVLMGVATGGHILDQRAAERFLQAHKVLSGTAQRGDQGAGVPEEGGEE